MKWGRSGIEDYFDEFDGSRTLYGDPFSTSLRKRVREAFPPRSWLVVRESVPYQKFKTPLSLSALFCKIKIPSFSIAAEISILLGKLNGGWYYGIRGRGRLSPYRRRRFRRFSPQTAGLQAGAPPQSTVRSSPLFPSSVSHFCLASEIASLFHSIPSPIHQNFWQGLGKMISCKVFYESISSILPCAYVHSLWIGNGIL